MKLGEPLEPVWIFLSHPVRVRGLKHERWSEREYANRRTPCGCVG